MLKLVKQDLRSYIITAFACFLNHFGFVLPKGRQGIRGVGVAMGQVQLWSEDVVVVVAVVVVFVVVVAVVDVVVGGAVVVVGNVFVSIADFDGDIEADVIVVDVLSHGGIGGHFAGVGLIATGCLHI